MCIQTAAMAACGIWTATGDGDVCDACDRPSKFRASAGTNQTNKNMHKWNGERLRGLLSWNRPFMVLKNVYLGVVVAPL